MSDEEEFWERGLNDQIMADGALVFEAALVLATCAWIIGLACVGFP
jgi:hypothetical protein